MHYSRLCALLIDCRTGDIDEAARFWAAALGRPVDPAHPGTRGNYRMLETPPDEPIVQIQRVEHESRTHLDRPALLRGAGSAPRVSEKRQPLAVTRSAGRARGAATLRAYARYR
jgi:hypothetical protein